MTETEKRKKIAELQNRLLVVSRATPLPRVLPDGVYGDETRAAVAAFQTATSLPATGVADRLTWDALVEAERLAIERDRPPTAIEPFDTYLEGGMIRPGDAFPTVFIIQAMLEELSRIYEFAEAVVLDGVYGPMTEDSVKRIQRSMSLPDTGEVDRATWNVLAELYNDSLKGHNR